MKEALEALNRLVEMGVIERYALGGAVAAFYHTETKGTFCLEPFVAPSTSIEPIHSAFRQRGYQELSRGGFVIGDWRVVAQIPESPLVEAALSCCLPVEYEGVRTQIFRLEYLAAICFLSDRRSERHLARQLFHEEAFDPARFSEILDRLGLKEAWDAFQSDAESNLEDDHLDADDLRNTARAVLRGESRVKGWEEKIRLIERVRDDLLRFKGATIAQTSKDGQ